MRRRNKQNIREETLRYCVSAIEFFKHKYNIGEVCPIEYEIGPSGVGIRFVTLGYYHFVENRIKIYGLKNRSRNEIVKTLFHELAHYWQYKIVKKLKYLSEVRNDEFCQSHFEASKIKDWYHMYYPMPKLHYEQRDTTSIEYYNKPHEIEARQMSKSLFEEWNSSEYKTLIHRE